MNLNRLSSKKTKKGSQSTETVTDSGSIEILKEILIEMRLMNRYLAEMTDLELEHGDLEK